MSTRAIVWSMGVSAGTHLLGLASAPALFVALAPVPVPVPIEVVSAPAPVPEPRPPAPAPRPQPAARRAAPSRAATEPRRPQLLETAPLTTDPAPAASPSIRNPLDVFAAPTTDRLSLPEPTLGGSSVPLLASPAGRGAGPSLLADRGDVAVGAGRGTPDRGTAELDRGVPGAVGSAVGRVSGSEAAGMVGSGALSMLAVPAGPGGGDGPITAFVRPLGGYQHTPPYPESARTQKVQGTTRLRFEVLATGRVGQVVVDQSAGHPDLDKAAADAVRQWRFEPARRGDTPVTVWVTLPVRFELR